MTSNEFELLTSNILSLIQKFQIPPNEYINKFTEEIKCMTESEISKIPEVIELYGFLYQLLDNSNLRLIYSVNYQEVICTLLSAFMLIIHDNNVEKKIFVLKNNINSKRHIKPKYRHVLSLKNRKSGLHEVPMEENYLYDAIDFLKKYCERCIRESISEKSPELRYVRDDIDALYLALDNIPKNK